VVAGVAVGTICVVLFLRLLPRRAAAGTDVARPPP
jgi:hypothetical protein